MNTKDKILQILQNSIPTQKIFVIDESDKHKGHKGAVESGGGHFKLFIVSDTFAGMPLLKRHKKIYSSLGPLMSNEIHALAITALTSHEDNT